jgi:hypothetical protein
MSQPPPPRWQRIYAIPGMLLFGTATVVTQKFLYESSGPGRSIYPSHNFSKPWFQTDAMFLGMMLSYIAFLLLRTDRDSSSPTSLKFYFAPAVPALCDLTATTLMNVQLLYLQASVWQMLRGSTTIFSSIFCAFILRRPHFPYMWWSVLGVAIALLIVGAAAVCSTGAGKAGVSEGKTIMAVVLTVVAQLIQASQLVIEDWLLHDMKTHPLQLVGLKGFWGFCVCSFVLMPIVQFLPGTEGNGIHEDVVDTFDMIGKNTLILVFVILYACFILGYNIGGMLVINVFSAVHRTILEGLRSLCIWVTEIILFYALQGSSYGRHHPGVGEEWTPWSFMELAGFLLLFTNTLMYNKIVQLPCWKYPVPLPDEPGDYQSGAVLQSTALIEQKERV